MKKRTKMLLAALSLAGLLVVSFASIALADDPADTDTVTQACWEQGWGHYHEHGAIYSETVSELLGLTPEEIHAQRHEGKSLVEMAAAQGVNEDTLVEAVLAAQKEIIQQRVAAGILTQEQADIILEQMEQRTIWTVNQTTFGPAGDGAFCGYGQAGYGMHGTGYGMHGMGYGGGMMGRGGWQSGSGAGYGGTGFGTGPGGMHGWGMGYR